VEGLEDSVVLQLPRDAYLTIPIGKGNDFELKSVNDRDLLYSCEDSPLKI